MSNSRLLVSKQNLILGVTGVTVGIPTLLNGTGGGAPAREEDTNFPMENAMRQGRYRIWKTSAAPAGTVNYDIDLLSAVPVTMAALTGMAGWGTGIGGYFTTCDVQAMTSGSYPGAPVFTTQGTIPGVGNSSVGMVLRDAGITFGTQSFRYWRLKFNSVGGQFSVGEIWLGTHADIGQIYNAGGITVQRRIRSMLPMPSGAQAVFDQGRSFRDFQLVFGPIPRATAAKIQPVADDPWAAVYADDNDAYWECLLTDGTLQTTRTWIDLYEVQLNITSLP